MQTISSENTTKSQNYIRRVHSRADVLFTNAYVEEFPFWYKYYIWKETAASKIDSIVIEREFAELYQGIYSAQADLSLINVDNQLTPIGNIPNVVREAPEMENVNRTNILKSSSGEFILFYDNDTETEIYYMVSNDCINWSEPILVTDDGKYPNATIDSSNNVHLTFTNGTSVSYVKFTYSSGEWSMGAVKEVQGVTPNETYYYPLVATLSDNTVWVCYKTIILGDHYFYATYSDDDGDTWTARVDYPDLPSSNKPNHTIVVRDDILNVFWLNLDVTVIFWGVWNGTDFDVSVAAVGDGNPEAICFNDAAGESIHILYSVGDALIHETSEDGISFSGQHIVYYAEDGYLGEYKLCSDGEFYIHIIFTHGLVPTLTQITLDMLNSDMPRTTPVIITQSNELTGATSGISALSISNSFTVYKTNEAYGDNDTIIPMLYVDKDNNQLTLNAVYSSPKYNFKRNLKSILKFSFADNPDSDYITNFIGKSDIPVINYADRTYKIHFYDDISYIQDFTLPYGQLYTDIRVDEYIRYILREYWGSRNYKVIASCDDLRENGTWLGYGDIVGALAVNTNTYKEGAGSFSAELDGDSGDTYIGIQNESLSGLNMSYFKDIGKIRLWVYISDVSKVSGYQIRFGDDIDNYFQIPSYADDPLVDFMGEELVNGWNLLEFDSKHPYIMQVGHPDLIDMTYFRFYIRFTDQTVNIPDILFDDICMYMPFIAPYYNDESLTRLNLAWYGGNQAGFEIERACMSEGARFYQDELGTLRFETRNHYINNEEHKSAVMSFDFSNTIKISYPIEPAKIINYVEFSFEPRKLQSIKEVWYYGEIPLIDANETITVWASLPDPCSSICLLYTSPSPRDLSTSRMPSSA